MKHIIAIRLTSMDTYSTQLEEDGSTTLELEFEAIPIDHGKILQGLRSAVSEYNLDAREEDQIVDAVAGHLYKEMDLRMLKSRML